MADITNSVVGTTNFVTDIILWVSTIFARIVTGVGMTEIIIFLLVGFCIWLWANQHSIQPKKVARF